MGINYYTMKGKHIGKYSATAPKHTFTWGVHPNFLFTNFLKVKDEYGKKLSRDEFKKLINNDLQWDCSLIGKDFI